jgi:anti-sigma factor RsiW
MTTCDRIDELRDYAMGELAQPARQSMELHVAACDACAAELASLKATTAALRTLPDRDIPQRIAFVSDKVFEPSPVASWFANALGGFWTSAARLGFASACVLSAALIVSVYHRPATVQPSALIQASLSKADVDKEISTEINAAVNRAVSQVRAEDARITAAALAASDVKHEREHNALLVAMEENMTVLQKRLTTYTTLAFNDDPRLGGGR